MARSSPGVRQAEETARVGCNHVPDIVRRDAEIGELLGEQAETSKSMPIPVACAHATRITGIK
jgi:hypothetical protein